MTTQTTIETPGSDCTCYLTIETREHGQSRVCAGPTYRGMWPAVSCKPEDEAAMAAVLTAQVQRSWRLRGANDGKHASYCTCPRAPHCHELP